MTVWVERRIVKDMSDVGLLECCLVFTGVCIGVRVDYGRYRVVLGMETPCDRE